MSALLDHAAPPEGIVPRDDAFARALRGFGPVGLAAFLLVYFGNTIVQPLTAALVLLWAWRSRTPWRDLGLARPRSWLLVLAGGIAFGAGFKLLMKALVMPLVGAPEVNQAFHYLAGNTAELPSAIFLMVVTAGFGEELFFRGFLFERLGRVFGASPGARVAIVAITAIWFGLEHVAFQGAFAAVQATIVGFVFGAFFAATGRLWPLIVAHAAFDLTALAIIFYDAEVAVARSILG